jgi:sugar/nucleoside kinase (ribokinase family)
MNKIICIGSSAKDIFFPTSDGVILDTPEDVKSQKKIAFELGAKYQIEDRYEALGGCAANVAVGLSRLGIQTSCYSRIGKDALGGWIINELKREKVDTGIMQFDEAAKSDLSAIIVESKTKDRTIFYNRDANEKLEVIPKNLENTEWFFISALNGDWEKHLDAFLEIVAQKKIRLALNPGQHNLQNNPTKVIEAIKKSKVLILNKDEAIEIISDLNSDLDAEKLNDINFLIRELKNLGPEMVALTDGANGAWAYDGKQLIHAGITDDVPLETTGAGDAFASAFLASHLENKSIEESIKWGMSNSGNVIKFYGAIEGLLTEKEISERINKIEIEVL